MNHHPVIGEKPKFYGYIVAVSVEHNGDYEDLKLFATFDYNGARKWRVPDLELFTLLSANLCDMAWFAAQSEWGYTKLWIEKKNGKWMAYLP